MNKYWKKIFLMPFLCTLSFIHLTPLFISLCNYVLNHLSQMYWLLHCSIPVLYLPQGCLVFLYPLLSTASSLPSFCYLCFPFQIYLYLRSYPQLLPVSIYHVWEAIHYFLPLFPQKTSLIHLPVIYTKYLLFIHR